METILLVVTIIMSVGVGLFCGYILWYHPCNHIWKLLEQHKGTKGGNWDYVQSVYACEKCGKLKALDF